MIDSEEMERWEPVEGFVGFYDVSTWGRIRSHDRKYHPGRILKPRPTGRGHLRVDLRSSGVKEWRLVHRIVATAFIPNPEGHPFVLHWDDNPAHNQVQNLRWGTRSDNTNDMIRNGRHVNARKTHPPGGMSSRQKTPISERGRVRVVVKNVF